MQCRGFLDSLVGKESACNSGDTGSIPGSGRSAREGIGYPLQYCWASLVAQLVKNPPAMQETWVLSLGWEDPLEKERLRTLVFWPGEFHGLYSPWRSQSQTRLSDFHFHFALIWLIAQLVKNLPAILETPVQFLGWEDLLEKG